nr:cytochrome c oxidase subunit 2 [Halipeurus diversus]
MVQFSFQDSWSPLMFFICSFHDHAMVIVTMIITLVSYIFFSFFFDSCCNRSFFENESLELIWTILPILVLAFLSVPSLFTLYLTDEVMSPIMSIKTVGHQWFWSYEYSEFEGLEFDSYMVPINDLNFGDFRLLEVDNKTVLPADCEIRMVVSSSDVIHSWTIPSMGVKVDAVPGRLNQLCLMSNRVGLMYGQCSEICGSLHSFMPICLEMVPDVKFFNWLKFVNY